MAGEKTAVLENSGRGVIYDSLENQWRYWGEAVDGRRRGGIEGEDCNNMIIML